MGCCARVSLTASALRVMCREPEVPGSRLSRPASQLGSGSGLINKVG